MQPCSHSRTLALPLIAQTQYSGCFCPLFEPILRGPSMPLFACARLLDASLRMCSPAVEVEKHPAGIIIRSHAPPKGIRFEISHDHWASEPATKDALPPRVVGMIEQWRNKDQGKIVVQWETDESNSDEYLSVLLRPPLGFKLLPYADNRSAPKAKGSAAKRAYAEAIARGPYAETERVEEQRVCAPPRRAAAMTPRALTICHLHTLRL
jgi:hypothetical protein